MTDAGGTVTLTQSYKPFGEVLSSTGSGASIYGFDGEQTDPSGLQYLRARYYAPGVGRFISRDAWGGDDKEPMSYNAWLFTYANPVMYGDPSGNERCEYYNNTTNCSEEGDDLPVFNGTRPYLQNYNPYVKPPTINFIGNDLKGKNTQFAVANNTICRHRDNPADTRCNSMCGEASLGAIFGLDVQEMFDIWVKVYPGVDPNNSGLGQLEGLIGKIDEITGRHTQHERFNMSRYTSDLSGWGRALSKFLSAGCFLIGGISVNGDTGLLQNTDENSRFYRNPANIVATDFVAHWIVITGISSSASWNDNLDYSNRNRRANIPYDKWLRIYNPISNRTEYYWWGDLLAQSLQSDVARSNRPTALDSTDYLAVKSVRAYYLEAPVVRNGLQQ